MRVGKKHFAVDKLSPEGRAIVDSMLGRNAFYKDIIAALRQKTGEGLALSSLSRYRNNKFFPMREVIAETDRLFSLLKPILEQAQGKTIKQVEEEILKAALFTAYAGVFKTKTADGSKFEMKS